MGTRDKTWAEKKQASCWGRGPGLEEIPNVLPAETGRELGEGARAGLPGFKEGVWSRQTSEVIS